MAIVMGNGQFRLHVSETVQPFLTKLDIWNFFSKTTLHIAHNIFSCFLFDHVAGVGECPVCRCMLLSLSFFSGFFIASVHRS